MPSIECHLQSSSTNTQSRSVRHVPLRAHREQPKPRTTTNLIIGIKSALHVTCFVGGRLELKSSQLGNL